MKPQISVQMEIAKVSIAKIGLGSPEPTFDDYKEVGESLREAFSKLGFVYISDHGVDDELITRLLNPSPYFPRASFNV